MGVSLVVWVFRRFSTLSAIAPLTVSWIGCGRGRSAGCGAGACVMRGFLRGGFFVVLGGGVPPGFSCGVCFLGVGLGIACWVVRFCV